MTEKVDGRPAPATYQPERCQCLGQRQQPCPRWWLEGELRLGGQILGAREGEWGQGLEGIDQGRAERGVGSCEDLRVGEGGLHKVDRDPAGEEGMGPGGVGDMMADPCREGPVADTDQGRVGSGGHRLVGTGGEGVAVPLRGKGLKVGDTVEDSLPVVVVAAVAVVGLVVAGGVLGYR